MAWRTYLLVLEVLGSMLEYAGELDVVEHAVLDRRLAVHLVHLTARIRL